MTMTSPSLSVTFVLRPMQILKQKRFKIFNCPIEFFTELVALIESFTEYSKIYRTFNTFKDFRNENVYTYECVSSCLNSQSKQSITHSLNHSSLVANIQPYMMSKTFLTSMTHRTFKFWFVHFHAMFILHMVHIIIRPVGLPSTNIAKHLLEV